MKYLTSGTIVFDGYDGRTTTIQGVQFYGTVQDSTGYNLQSDPVPVTSITRSQTYDSGVWYDYGILVGHYPGGSVTIASSGEEITGLNINVDASVSIDYVGGLGLSIPIDVSVSTTTSYSDVLSFEVHNTGTSSHSFTAWVQYGTGTETGLILHVWQVS